MELIFVAFGFTALGTLLGLLIDDARAAMYRRRWEEANRLLSAKSLFPDAELEQKLYAGQARLAQLEASLESATASKNTLPGGIPAVGYYRMSPQWRYAMEREWLRNGGNPRDDLRGLDSQWLFEFQKLWLSYGYTNGYQKEMA